MALIEINSLHQLHLDIQRDHLDECRVQYYLSHPGEIREVLIYENPHGGERILVNGHHRVEAARRLNQSQIDAELKPGTRIDASMYRDSERKPWSEIRQTAGEGLDST
jgi:hypothetical protein